MPKKRAHPIDGQVGNRLRLRRMMIGMSQEKLGESLGLTFQQVQKYEKGVNRIGAGRLYDIARILGVPIQYFYESIVEPPGNTPGFVECNSQSALDFLSSGDALQLSRAYMSIKDPKVRELVLDLVRSLD